MFFQYDDKMGKFVLGSGRITSRKAELLVRLGLFLGKITGASSKQLAKVLTNLMYHRFHKENTTNQ